MRIAHCLQNTEEIVLISAGRLQANQHPAIVGALVAVVK